MFETVSVNNALKAGQRRINLPVLFVMLGFWGLTVGLIAYFKLPAWLFAIVIPGGIVLAWVYWSFAITKWKVWAFDNVRNVHELKHRAVADKLIWPDGHFFNRTELWTPADRLKWEQLQPKFELKDVYEDDLSVPDETIVAYSRTKIYTEMAIAAAIFVGCGYIYLFVEQNYKLWYGIIGGPLMIVIEVVRLFRKKTRMVLNNEGISTANSPFCKWEYVFDATVTAPANEGSGSLRLYYYDENLLAHKVINISLDNLNFKPRQVEDLLRVYRVRAEKRGRRVEE